MDFLSTPLPPTSGTEEHFVKQRLYPFWLKGRKQTKEQIAKRTKAKHIWGGKTAKEWVTILNGDYWIILKHIQNGTMEDYDTYRKWKGSVRLKRNQNNIKRFMTPNGVMTYIEAKEAFGFKDAEAIRNRIRSEKPEYADWHWLEETQ